MFVRGRTMLGPCQRNILLIWNCFFSNRALAKKRQEADMYGKALFDFRIERFLRVTRVTRVVASSCFWTSDIRHQTSDIRHQIRPQTSDTRHQIRSQTSETTRNTDYSRHSYAESYLAHCPCSLKLESSI